MSVFLPLPLKCCSVATVTICGAKVWSSDTAQGGETVCPANYSLTPPSPLLSFPSVTFLCSWVDYSLIWLCYDEWLVLQDKENLTAGGDVVWDTFSKTVWLTLPHPLTAAQVCTSAYGRFCPVSRLLFLFLSLRDCLFMAGYNSSITNQSVLALLLLLPLCHVLDVWGAHNFQTQTLWRIRHVWRRTSVIWTERRWKLYSQNLSHFLCIEHARMYANTHTLQLQTQTKADCFPRWQDSVSFNMKIKEKNHWIVAGVGGIFLHKLT